MTQRFWMTIGVIGGLVSLVALSVSSWWSWSRSWSAIFTGAELVSPLGCDCGVDISFWQHPWIYGLGLLATALISALTVWIGFALVRSWLSTRRVLRDFSPVVTQESIQALWVNALSQIWPTFLPAWLTPRLTLIQDDQPRAMSTGLFRPQVYCSTGAISHLSQSELLAVLTHELMHLRSLDPLLLWTTAAITGILPRQWRTPLQAKLTQYIECQTDLEAAQVVGKSSVGRALLQVVAWEEQPALAATAHIHQGVVETRLQVLAGWVKRPSFPWQPAAGLVVGFLVVLAGFYVSLRTVDAVYATELRSPACLATQSILIVDHQVVLLCPKIMEYDESYIPMSPLQ